MSKEVLYTLFDTNDYETYQTNLTEDEVIKYFNDMIRDINIDNGEDVELCKTFEEVMNIKKDYGIEICRQDSTDNEIVVAIIKQALKFNSSWSGRTKRKEHESYYAFNIKPLYIGEQEYIIQVVCNTMCPSGISDNGIKSVHQLNINIHAFSDIRELCKKIVGLALPFNTNKSVEYIQF